MSEPAAQPAKRIRLHGKQNVQETCPPTAPGAEVPAAVREVYLVTPPHPERPQSRGGVALVAPGAFDRAGIRDAVLRCCHSHSSNRNWNHNRNHCLNTGTTSVTTITTTTGTHTHLYIHHHHHNHCHNRSPRPSPPPQSQPQPQPQPQARPRPQPQEQQHAQSKPNE